MLDVLGHRVVGQQRPGATPALARHEHRGTTVSSAQPVGGNRRERRHHHAVGLQVVTQAKLVRTDIDEAEFSVERLRAMVLLPHAKPHCRGTARLRRLERDGHQLVRQAAAMMREIDVETP